MRLKELEKIEAELGQTKCELASIAYERDEVITKYKKYINRLKEKLNSMGLRFQSKRTK